MYVGTIITFSALITACIVANDVYLIHEHDQSKIENFETALRSFEKKARFALSGLFNNFYGNLNKKIFANGLSYEKIGNVYFDLTSEGFKFESITKAFHANLNNLYYYIGILAGFLVLLLILLVLICRWFYLEPSEKSYRYDGLGCKMTLISVLLYFNLHILALVWGIMIVTFVEFSQHVPSKEIVFHKKLHSTIDLFESETFFALEGLILNEFNQFEDSFISKLNHSTDSVVDEYLPENKAKFLSIQKTGYIVKVSSLNNTINDLTNMLPNLTKNDKFFGNCSTSDVKIVCDFIHTIYANIEKIKHAYNDNLSEISFENVYDSIGNKFLVSKKVQMKPDNISLYFNNNLEKFHLSRYYSLYFKNISNWEAIWNKFVKMLKYDIPLVCILPAGVILILSVITICCIARENQSNIGNKLVLKFNSLLGFIIFLYYLFVALSCFAILSPASKICHDMNKYDVIHDVIEKPFFASENILSLSNIIRRCGNGETVFEVLNFSLGRSDFENLLPNETDVVQILWDNDLGGEKQFDVKIKEATSSLIQLNYLTNAVINTTNSVKKRILKFGGGMKMKLKSNDIIKVINNGFLKKLKQLRNETNELINDLNNKSDGSSFVSKLEKFIKESESTLKLKIAAAVKSTYTESKKDLEHSMGHIENSTIGNCLWMQDIWEAFLVQICDYAIDGTISTYMNAGPLAITILINFFLFITFQNQQ